MLNSFRKLWVQEADRSLRSLVFFALFYLYLLLDVEPRLIYHGGGYITNFPVFYRDWVFFSKFMTYPGGLIEYASAFLAQFFYYNWTGALVITLQAWLVSVCFDNILKAVNDSSLYLARYIAPVLLLILYTQYTYYFDLVMALLAGLIFMCLYLRIKRESSTFRLAAFLLLSVILYYLVAGTYIVFAAVCAIFELFFRRKALGLLYLLGAVAIPYVMGGQIMNVSIVGAFYNATPFSWKLQAFPYRQKMVSMVYALYLLTPAVLVLLGLCGLVFGMPASLQNKPCKKKTDKKQQGGQPEIAGIFALSLQAGNIKSAIKSLLLFIIVGVVIMFYRHSELKVFSEIDYYAHHKKWDQVLKSARCFPNPNVHFVIHSVNRALYHTGRLAFDMFSYPQHPDALFLITKKHRFAHWERINIFIELGVINKAENAMVVSLEKYGERPILLKHLALINMVKANPGAARVYLGALSKTLFHDEWANNCLTNLYADPNFATDDRIQQLRNLMIEKDSTFGSYSAKNSSFGGYSAEGLLLALLEKNRQNRMAFEYLMALYLVSNQLEKVIENLHRLDDFGYSQIPPLYEEAILIYTGRTKMPVDLHGRQISDESRRRYNNFMQTYDKSNPRTARRTLKKDYGDSFLFHHIFSGRRPWKKNIDARF